jgi:hypothetical protein
MGWLERGRRPSAAVTAALTQVCRGTWSGPELSARDADEFIDAVRLHRIAPLAHVVVRDAAPDLAQRLRSDRDTAFGRNLAASMVLGELGRVLRDIPWVTFKGAALSAIAHPAPGLRSFMDIDALVAPAQLRTACERLAAAGWELLDYDDMLAARPIPGELHWKSPVGMGIDLHWSMINREARRSRFRIPTEDIIARRRTVSLGLGDAPTLDPDDALVHVCVHSSLDGANTLLHLVDADGLARRVSDWDGVSRRARQWRAGAQVWLVLSRAHALAGTPLPAGLADQLGVPAGLRRLLAAIDRLAPIAATRSAHGLPRLVARALHPNLSATLLAASRNGLQGIQDRVRPPQSATGRVPAREATLLAFLTEVEDRAGVASPKTGASRETGRA